MASSRKTHTANSRVGHNLIVLALGDAPANPDVYMATTLAQMRLVRFWYAGWCTKWATAQMDALEVH